MKFKLAPQDTDELASGTHYHNGKPYRHGDVIESDEDLQVKFPGKFTRMPDDTPVTPPRKGGPMSMPSDEFADPRHNPPAEPAAEEQPPEPKHRRK